MHVLLTFRFLGAISLVCSLAACDAGCGDTSRDEMNCGGCGLRCLPWLECNSGSCECPSGTVECSASCSVLADDSDNCGRCGVACPATATCEFSRCECPEGSGLCGDRCQRLVDDSMHCGACGNACGPGQTCVAGSCSCIEDSLDACPLACTDLSSAEDSCGECGLRCAVGATCFAGSCECPASRVVCDEGCVNTRTDSLHCGGCGRACAAALTCLDGSCGCPGEQTQCGVICVHLDSDPMHCGSCSTSCAEDEACGLGRCVPGYRWHVTRPARGFMSVRPAWDGRVAVSDDGHVYVAYTEDPDGVVTLLRYSPYGSLLWRQTFYASAERVDDIAVGASGNVVLAATFRGFWTSPGRPRHGLVTTSNNVAIIALDPMGTVLWERFVESPGFDSAAGVTMRASRVVVSGSLAGSFDFGGGLLWADTYRDAFIYEMRESDGAYVAARVYGDAGTEAQVFVALAEDGDFIVAGRSGAGVNFGGGRTATTVAGFVARLGPDFAHRWSRSIRVQEVFGIDIMADGRIVVGAEVMRNTDFGSGVSWSGGGIAHLVLALDGATGNASWVAGVRGDWAHPGRGPVVDARGSVWMGASVQGPIGSYDATLMGLDSSGRVIYLRAFGSDREDVVTGLATRGATLVFAGRFGGTAVFGSSTERSSSRDLFMMAFDL